MIYVKSDFYSNFNGAVKSNDDQTVKTMLVDQFSNLIANRRGEVLQLFQKVGIVVSSNPTNEEIANKIVTNIATNKKLQVGLSYLIAKDNDLLVSADKKSRVEGDEAEKGDSKDSKKDRKPIDWSKTADAVTSISGTISTFTESIKGAKGNQFEQELINQANNKNPNYSAQAYDLAGKGKPAKKSRKWLWISLVGIVVIGGAVIAYKKGYFAKKVISE